MLFASWFSRRRQSGDSDHRCEQQTCQDALAEEREREISRRIDALEDLAAMMRVDEDDSDDSEEEP